MVRVRELIDEPVDCLEDRGELREVAAQRHPRAERADTLLGERIEGLVDDRARIGLAAPHAQHGLADLARDMLADGARKLRLEAMRRAEMMKHIGMGSPDPRRDRRECHGLGALFDQDRAGGSQCLLPAFLLRQSFACARLRHQPAPKPDGASLRAAGHYTTFGEQLTKG